METEFVMTKDEFLFEIERLNNYCDLQFTSFSAWKKENGKSVSEMDKELIQKVNDIIEAHQRLLEYLKEKKKY